MLIMKKSQNKTKKTSGRRKNSRVNKKTAAGGKFEVISKANRLAGGSKAELLEMKANKKQDAFEVLIFKAGPALFAVELRSILEVLGLLTITPIPLSRDYVLGLVNVRNEIIAVLDIRKIMEGEFVKPIKTSRILVLNSREMSAGIVIDKVEALFEVTKSDIEYDISALKIKFEEYVKYLIKYDKKDIPVIDVEKIFELNKYSEIE